MSKATFGYYWYRVGADNALDAATAVVSTACEVSGSYNKLT